jgi:hypothetical protein
MRKAPVVIAIAKVRVSATAIVNPRDTGIVTRIGSAIRIVTPAVTASAVANMATARGASRIAIVIVIAKGVAKGVGTSAHASGRRARKQRRLRSQLPTLQLQPTRSRPHPQ